MCWKFSLFSDGGDIQIEEISALSILYTIYFLYDYLCFRTAAHMFGSKTQTQPVANIVHALMLPGIAVVTMLVLTGMTCVVTAAEMSNKHHHLSITVTALSNTNV